MKTMRHFEISVRSLVEFILRSGDIESGLVGTAADPERALLGTRLHQKLQKKEGPDYQKEVPFQMTVSYPKASLRILGRADGIFRFNEEKMLEEKSLRSRRRTSGKGRKVQQLTLEDDEVTDPFEDDFAFACALLTEPDGHDGIECIDEIKSTAVDLSEIHTDTYPLHFAQGAFYAYMLLKDKEDLSRILVRVTYIHTESEEVRHLYRLYTKQQLTKFVEEVIESYSHYILWKTAWEKKRQEGLSHLAFPFDSYRKGQKEMMDAIEKAIDSGKNLFLQAPTGIGKTMSAIFPSLLSMGHSLDEQGPMEKSSVEKGRTEMIFYLTSKNVTGTVALEALDLLKQKNGLHLKVLQMTAKEAICPLEKRKCNANDCPYARGHFDRVNKAVLSALERHDRFDKETVLALSKEFMVCPHELELDIASWCDLVIADVNYAFDPSARLKRFFQTGLQPYVLLIDEAHNLVERARDMFSAELSMRDLAVLKRNLPSTPGLKRALTKMEKLFKDAAFLMGDRVLLRGAEDSSSDLSIEDGSTEIERIPFGEEAGSFLLNAQWKENIFQTVRELKGVFEMLAKEKVTVEDPVLDSYFRVLFFERILEEHEDGYEIFLEKAEKRLTLHLFCVDPSKPIRQVTDGVLSSIFFSATLQPTEYFTRLLGKKAKDSVLEIASPFDKSHRVIMTAPVPQTFRQRDRSLPVTAELILSFIRAREGRYMVFLPSFRYLEQFRQMLLSMDPSLKLLVQESGMGQEDRTRLLEAFKQTKGTVLMLNVLGGVFSEGIDLRGDQLIGAAIVSAALPQIGPERDLIKTHFGDEGYSFGEEPSEGFMIAYTYPGMNRVLQAAGRVIRTEEDKGAVLLIDDRFESKAYERLFPADYQDHFSVNRETLPGILLDFWNRMEAK